MCAYYELCMHLITPINQTLGYRKVWLISHTCIKCIAHVECTFLCHSYIHKRHMRLLHVTIYAYAYCLPIMQYTLLIHACVRVLHACRREF